MDIYTKLRCRGFPFCGVLLLFAWKLEKIFRFRHPGRSASTLEMNKNKSFIGSLLDNGFASVQKFTLMPLFTLCVLSYHIRLLICLPSLKFFTHAVLRLLIHYKLLRSLNTSFPWTAMRTNSWRVFRIAYITGQVLKRDRVFNKKRCILGRGIYFNFYENVHQLKLPRSSG